MENVEFNFNSPRSQKARIGLLFRNNTIVLLVSFMVSLLIIGVALLIFGQALGWAVLGFSVVPFMVVEWCELELRDQPINVNAKTVDDVLSSEVLSILPADVNPRQLAELISDTHGSHFYYVRFGISAKFLRDLLSQDRLDMKEVWKEAWRLRQTTGSDKISSAILIVALSKCAQNSETLLSHLQLDYDDLVSGIAWFNRLDGLSGKMQLLKKTGGMARDWSFGWTPLLDRFGINISQQVEFFDSSLVRLEAHQDSMNQIINIFSKKGRQNVVLVGPAGAGKAQIVNSLAYMILDGASKSIPESLRYRQVFMLDASALIAAAPDRGGLERLIPQVLGEAYAAKNIIMCLKNAQLFFEDGIGSVDVSNVLLPIIEAGNLRMILTMDEQRYLEISRRSPQLINALNRINVPPATREETIVILQDRSLLTECQNNVVFMYQALVEAYRLGDRYVQDLAMPGKALSLLETASHFSEDGLVTAKSVRSAIESTMGIKVGVASDQNEREKLLNMEDLIHKRMINQTRAVGVVSDALRRARTGVRNQNRPIGTFLFLGPTGVGKSELAKSLAAVYFGGEERVIRLDMNEYVSPGDIARLIADAADNSNSLTARVIKQPFSVVLLDEIEKAHQNVVLTLLQMLDEGILRDEKNREVSFRDAIIIATSNAGADRIREFIERGYDLEQFEDQFVNELISSNQFKPEFLNRFDEIVVFRPLSRDELIKVVDLILDGVNKTLSVQKISVGVDDDAKQYLVDAGYDPRLGARPMRRVIQRAVENTVAKRMLSGEVSPGSVIRIDLDHVKKILESKNEADRILEKSK